MLSKIAMLRIAGWRTMTLNCIMNGKPLNLSYNQQINNHHTNHRSLHTHSEKLIFNGPIFGYTHHVTGKGPVICYSQYTHAGPTDDTGLFQSKQETSSRTSGNSNRYVKIPSEENPCHELFNGAGSASLTRSFEKGEFPIERSVFEKEYQMLSHDMQLYVKHLLEVYAKRDTTEASQAQGG